MLARPPLVPPACPLATPLACEASDQLEKVATPGMREGSMVSRFSCLGLALVGGLACETSSIPFGFDWFCNDLSDDEVNVVPPVSFSKRVCRLEPHKYQQELFFQHFGDHSESQENTWPMLLRSLACEATLQQSTRKAKAEPTEISLKCPHKRIIFFSTLAATRLSLSNLGI